MVKSQHSNMYDQEQQNDNSYYIDTLHGMGGTLNHNEMAPDNHLISINRIGHSNQNSTSKLPEPYGSYRDSPGKNNTLQPEKDMMYDT